jgi:hypothetical protein
MYARAFVVEPVIVADETTMCHWVLLNRLCFRLRRFRATIAIDGKEYMSANWEKSKKMAEQSTSIVVLNTLEIPYTYVDTVPLVTSKSFKRSHYGQLVLNCQMYFKELLMLQEA